jgi:hypothetical protein
MKTTIKVVVCSVITLAYTFVNLLLTFKSGMSVSASLVTPLLYYVALRLFFAPINTDIFYI